MNKTDAHRPSASTETKCHECLLDISFPGGKQKPMQKLHTKTNAITQRWRPLWLGRDRWCGLCDRWRRAADLPPRILHQSDHISSHIYITRTHAHDFIQIYHDAYTTCDDESCISLIIYLHTYATHAHTHMISYKCIMTHIQLATTKPASAPSSSTVTSPGIRRRTSRARPCTHLHKDIDIIQTDQTHAHTHRHTHTYTHTHTCLYVYMYINICEQIYMKYVWRYICIISCVCVCVRSPQHFVHAPLHPTEQGHTNNTNISNIYVYVYVWRYFCIV